MCVLLLVLGFALGVAAALGPVHPVAARRHAGDDRGVTTERDAA